MTFRVRAVVIALAMVVTGTFTADLQAADAKLTRVLLLRSGNRLSLAVEMTVEPQKVLMRSLGPAMLEVEVGPVSGRVDSQQLTPAIDVPFVGQVSIREFAAVDRPTFVRMRVRLRGPSHSNVRIVGRTVYIDFVAPNAARQTLRDESAAAARLREPMARAPERGESTPSAELGYREAIGAPVARLMEIGPFLISAAHTPTADVLDAVARTLATVHDSLRAVDVPSAAVPAHRLLTSAVVLATRAVATDFTGDRLAQARLALALVDDARAQIP